MKLVRASVDELVGRNVRIRRISLKMSAEQLAAKIGVTLSQVEKYESGANRIAAGRLQQIALALDTGIASFFIGAPGSSVVEFPQPPSQGQAISLEHETALAQQALELNRAYARIRDPEARKKILDLTISLAEAESKETET